MNKSVMLSIQPYYGFLIIARRMGWKIPQEKTIEVRKNCPQDPAWNNRIHIYCSRNRRSFKRIPKQYQPLMERLLGKVIGEFVCDRIDAYSYHKGLTQFGGELGLPIGTYDSYLIFEDDYKAMCLSYDEVKDYGKGKTLYGLHISDLKSYDNPKELGEFKRCQCKYMEQNPNLTCDCYCKYGNRSCFEKSGAHKSITRPPQSWQFVEVLCE